MSSLNNHILKSLLYIAVVLLLFSWLTPNHYQPWMSAYSEFSAFLSLILIFIAFQFCAASFKLPKITLGLFCIVAIMIMQWMFNAYMYLSDVVLYACYIFGLIISVGVGFSYSKIYGTEKAVGYIGVLFLFGGLISTYIALRQWLFLDGYILYLEPAGHKRPYGNFGQPNMLATFLLFCTVFCIYFYEKHKIGLRVFSLLFILLIFGVCITQSRTAWVSATIVLLWFLYNNNKIRLTKKQVLCGFFMFVGLVLAMPSISNFVLPHVINENVIYKATHGLGRLSMWKMFIVAILDKPITGYGWGQIPYAQLHISPQIVHYELAQFSHNFILDLLLWNGIPLGFGLIVYFVFWFVRLIRSIKSIESTVIVSILLIFSVHCMLEFPHTYAYFLMPMGGLVGVMEAQRIDTSFYSIKQSTSLVACMIFFVMFTSLCRDYLVLEKDNQLLRFELNNVGEVHSSVRAQNMLVLKKDRDYIKFMRTNPFQNYNEQELQWMKKVVYNHPFSIVLKRYCQALYHNKKNKEANEIATLHKILYGSYINFDGFEKLKITANKALVFQWKTEKK